MTVEEIKAYFKGIELPASVQIDSGVVIQDLPLFIESHIHYLEVNAGKRPAEVYMERIEKLIAALEAKAAD
jgi:hypothetical protein